MDGCGDPGRKSALILALPHHQERRAFPRLWKHPGTHAPGPPDHCGRFLIPARMAGITDHRQHATRTQHAPARLQRRQGFIRTGDHRMIRPRQITQIEHHRAHLPIHPQRQHRMALLEKLHPRGQARRRHPRAGRFDRGRLHIDRHHPATLAHQTSQKHRIMAVSRRGIHHQIAGFHRSSHDFMRPCGRPFRRHRRMMNGFRELDT